MLRYKFIEEKGSYNFQILLGENVIFEGYGWSTREEMLKMLHFYFSGSNLLSNYKLHSNGAKKFFFLFEKGALKIGKSHDKYIISSKAKDHIEVLADFSESLYKKIKEDLNNEEAQARKKCGPA